MRLTDYISVDLIDTDLRGADKVECLRQMVDRLGRAKAISNPATGLERVLDRERMMSTGIGNGLAIPHAKSGEMTRSRVAFGRVRDGVDFESVDGQPVRLIFLLVGPTDSASTHVKILSIIARLTRNEDFRDRLLGAEQAVDVIKLIREEERK